MFNSYLYVYHRVIDTSTWTDDLSLTTIQVGPLPWLPVGITNLREWGSSFPGDRWLSKTGKTNHTYRTLHGDRMGMIWRRYGDIARNMVWASMSMVLRWFTMVYTFTWWLLDTCHKIQSLAGQCILPLLAKKWITKVSSKSWPSLLV